MMTFFGLHIVVGIIVIIMTVKLEKLEAKAKKESAMQSGMMALVDNAFDEDEDIDLDDSDDDNSNNVVMSSIGPDGKYESRPIDKSTKPKRIRTPSCWHYLCGIDKYGCWQALQELFKCEWR